VLGTTSDTRAAWLDAGQALAQVLVRAAAAGVAASFLNAPVEIGDLRPRVSELVGRTAWAQMVLRLGYGTGAAPTPPRAACTLRSHQLTPAIHRCHAGLSPLGVTLIVGIFASFMSYSYQALSN